MDTPMNSNPLPQGVNYTDPTRISVNCINLCAAAAAHEIVAKDA
jgi:hypothetical protein